MYTDTTEILEALGFNPAFGIREWYGAHHVDDVMAIAEVLELRQRGVRARWVAPSEEAAFLFSEQLEDFARDLDIARVDEPARSEALATFVVPSFKSFGVDGRYIAEKTAQFFRIHCVEDGADAMWIEHVLNTNRDEWHINLMKHLNEHPYTHMTLVRLPVHYRYASHEELRFELMRVLQDAVRRYGRGDVYFAHGLSVRRLHWEAVHFVEALWGMREDIS